MSGKHRVAQLALVILFSSFLISLTFGPGAPIHENSFLINGEGFLNQKMVLKINSVDAENIFAKGSYNYNQDYQNMTIRISGATDTVASSPVVGIDMDFNSFTKPGMYTSDSALSVSIFFRKNNASSEYEQYYILKKEGIIQVKSYGPVGGLIEGTFSGIFVKMKYNKENNAFEETNSMIKISDGKFSVAHNPDYHWDAPQSVEGESVDNKEKKKKGKKI